MKLFQILAGIALVIPQCWFVGAVESAFDAGVASESVGATSTDWYPWLPNNYDTCAHQKDFLEFTITALTDAENICHGCKTYNVCLTLKLRPDEYVQHTCVKNGSICGPPDFSTYNGLNWIQSGVGRGNGQTVDNPDAITADRGTQCQIGSNGTVLEFLIDDGRCWVGPEFPGYPDGAVKIVPPVDDPANNPAFEFTCHSRKYWNEQGNLDHPIGTCCDCREEVDGCVWRIELPGCTKTKETSPYSPSLSPSPPCYCPPINAECQKEEERMEESGYEHHIEITDCKDPQGVADFVNQMGIDFYHGSFNCHVSTIPDCNSIYCESFVPEWIYSNFSTCPIPSPSPVPL